MAAVGVVEAGWWRHLSGVGTTGIGLLFPSLAEFFDAFGFGVMLAEFVQGGALGRGTDEHLLVPLHDRRKRRFHGEGG